MPQGIEVRWLTGTAAGFTDLFPLEEFTSEVIDVDRVHVVRGPHGGDYMARYRLTVAGRTATLDYEVFEGFNERQGMDIGVMVLEFADSSRTQPTGLRWDGRRIGGREATITVNKWKASNSSSEIVAKQQQAFAQQQLRPGQAEFRRRLDLVYGFRCCISECPVAWALQAAHITAFADDSSANSAENGLLLRADLHALFDANQLAIHPETRVVFFAPEAAAWPEYAAVHGRQKIAQPQAGFVKHAPSKPALTQRWKKFVHMHGAPEDNER